MDSANSVTPLSFVTQSSFDASPHLMNSISGRPSYVSEIQTMLFAFGDCPSPKYATAQLIEEICQLQMAEILIKCCDIARLRDAIKVGIEDLLFLMRKNPVKIQRLVQYMSVMEVLNSVKNGTNGIDPDINLSSSLDGKRVRRCRDFLAQIDDDESGLLYQAGRQLLEDKNRLERLRRLDRLSRDLDERRYAEFSRARQVSFLGQKMKLSQKFYDWILQAVPGELVDSLVPMDRSALEAMAYLAYETVGQIVDMSLQIRHDMTTGDSLLRLMAPSVYNSMYLPQEASLTNGMLDDKPPNAQQISMMRPLEPQYVLEVIRRLALKPPALGWTTKSVKSNSLHLIAI